MSRKVRHISPMRTRNDVGLRQGRRSDRHDVVRMQGTLGTERFRKPGVDTRGCPGHRQLSLQSFLYRGRSRPSTAASLIDARASRRHLCSNMSHRNDALWLRRGRSDPTGCWSPTPILWPSATTEGRRVLTAVVYAQGVASVGTCRRSHASLRPLLRQRR